MGIVLSQNFDSVTAPSLPSNIFVIGSIATSTTQFLSSPNSIASPATGGLFYSSSTDKSSGNCTVTASIYQTVALNSPLVMLTVGSQGFPISVGVDSYCLVLTPTGFAFNRYNSGVGTNLAFSTSAPSLGAWYTLVLTRNGSSFWIAIQRQSDLNWMTSTAWQLNYTNFAVTDGSPLAQVNSYGGVLLNSPNPIYVDNFSVYDQTNTLPAGLLRGLNIGPAFYPNSQNDMDHVWGDTYSLRGQGGIETQIDLAISAGCDCVRILGGLKAIVEGMIDLPTYLGRLSTVIAYCKSKNLAFYASDQPYLLQSVSGSQATAFPFLTNYLASVASVLTGFSNVFAYDIWQEFNGAFYTGIVQCNLSPVQSGTFAMTPAQWFTLITQSIAAVRAVAPNLPLTCSFNGITSSAGWTVAQVPVFSYLFDYIDQHVYYSGASPVGASDSQALYTNIGTYGKKFIMGEFGDLSAFPDGTVNNQTVMTTDWNNIVKATYTGQPGCIGALWWDVLPQATVTTAGDYGMWDNANPAVARGWKSTFAGLTPAPQQFTFGGNFRRRRR